MSVLVEKPVFIPQITSIMMKKSWRQAKEGEED